MDTPNRDQMRERRLEEMLARRVGEALDRLSPRTGGECPEAEVIAAYHEKALGPEESAHCESHFAECPRCRKVFAVLSASVEEPLAESEVARLGELVAAAARTPQVPPSQKEKSQGSSRWDWRARWLAPALGVAAVLAVWFAMRPPWRTVRQESSGTLIAQARKSEPPSNTEPADNLSKVEPEQNQKSDAAIPRDRSATNTRPLGSSVEAPAESRADSSNAVGQVSPGAGGAAITLQEEKRAGGLSGEGVIRPSAVATPPPQPSPKVQAATEAPATLQAQAAAGSVAVGGEGSGSETNTGAAGNSESRDKPTPAPQRAVSPMAAPQAAPRAAANAGRNQSLSLFKAAAETPGQIKSPSGSTIWRFGKGGSIERSVDAGRTWIAQTSPSSEDWLAGNAVSDTTGWLAGRDGAIARTTDGEVWERVVSPPQAVNSTTKLPDWTGISAMDAQIATITARDGRRFTTRDGGITWQAQ